MSILIGMLQDLDRRGQAPRVDPGIASALEHAADPQPAAGYARGRRAILGLTVLFPAAIAVLLLFRPGLLPFFSAQPAAPIVALPAVPVSLPVVLPNPPPAPLPASVSAPAPVPHAVTLQNAANARAAIAPVPAPRSAVASKPAPATIAVARPVAARPTAPAPSAPAPVAASEPAPVVQRKAGGAEQAPELARAYELAQRGRNVEAIAVLRQGLREFPGHRESRHALAALLSERDQRAEARDVLLEGAAIDPVGFALDAARLQADLGHPAAALATAALVPEAARDPQYHAQAGAIAQRAGRHDLAVEEFRSALAGEAARAIWWVALGASLEQTDHRPEALGAYRQALAVGGASQGARDFATGRVAALVVPLVRDTLVTTAEPAGR